MTDAAQPALRWQCISAALTAWCAFWGTLGAVTTVVSYAVLLGGVDMEEPGEIARSVYVGLLTLCAGLVSFFITRWQWTRMLDSRASDHRSLAIVLIIVGIAVAPQPFVFVSVF